MPETKKSALRDLLEWVVVLVVAFICALLIQRFVASPYTVPTGSMEQTIQIGDNIFAQKVTVELGQPVAPGDIVVFNNPNASSDHDILVKRVIAAGGQTVDIDFDLGRVYVDGVLLEEEYINDLTYLEEGTEFPLTVPEGSVFLMGDNRNHSSDSRDERLGPVDERLIIGKAVFLLFPGKDYLTEKRDLSRIGLLK